MKMQKKRILKVLMIAIVTVAFAITCGKSYSKYILTRHFDTIF